NPIDAIDFVADPSQRLAFRIVRTSTPQKDIDNALNSGQRIFYFMRQPGSEFTNERQLGGVLQFSLEPLLFSDIGVYYQLLIRRFLIVIHQRPTTLDDDRASVLCYLIKLATPLSGLCEFALRLFKFRRQIVEQQL